MTNLEQFSKLLNINLVTKNKTQKDEVKRINRSVSKRIVNSREVNWNKIKKLVSNKGVG